MKNAIVLLLVLFFNAEAKADSYFANGWKLLPSCLFTSLDSEDGVVLVDDGGVIVKKFTKPRDPRSPKSMDCQIEIEEAEQNALDASVRTTAEIAAEQAVIAKSLADGAVFRKAELGKRRAAALARKPRVVK